MKEYQVEDYIRHDSFDTGCATGYQRVATPENGSGSYVYRATAMKDFTCVARRSVWSGESFESKYFEITVPAGTEFYYYG